MVSLCEYATDMCPLIFAHRPSMLVVAHGARILERQNVLRTSQILFRRLAVNFALVLPFEDSSEAAEPRCSTPSAIELPDTPRRSEAPRR